MSINGVFSLRGCSISAQNTLSEETKRKLIALGIDPSTVTSEAQAQVLIANAQQVQKVSNQSSSQNTCSSELELISRAKELAKKLNLSISPNDNLKLILEKIQTKINTISDEDKNKNQLQSELTSIQNEYLTVEQNQNSMITAMNLTANMNKFMLGLQ